jgi:hypothetical protein
MCTDEEKRTWCRLESAILAILRNDGAVLRVYLDLREELLAVAQEKMDFQ